MTRPITALLLFLLLGSGCFRGTGDVLMLPDGAVLQGSLQSISSGRAVFDSGTADVSGQGRIWLSDGTTERGHIAYTDGLFRAGSREYPGDSVILVLWGDTEVRSESFQVGATGEWVNTGIDLKAGDMLSIAASGTVVTETGPSTPEGQERFASSVALVPGATSGQLVFKAGEAGSPVAAGGSWVGESPSEGPLMLAVNIPRRGSIDTGGVYTVHVTAGSGGRQGGTTALYPASR